MSDSIYIRVGLTKEFYCNEISEFLFSIIEEGCRKRLAINIVSPDLIDCESTECIISLSDSYNFQLVNPLIGKDYDGEVLKYRPVPLCDRLLNLQNFFKSILKESVVKQIEVFFTENYDIDDLENVEVDIQDFAHMFEPTIINNKWSGLSHRFFWTR